MFNKYIDNIFINTYLIDKGDILSDIFFYLEENYHRSISIRRSWLSIIMASVVEAAIVTGAAQGIGKSIATSLLKQGYKVCVPLFRSKISLKYSLTWDIFCYSDYISYITSMLGLTFY